MKLMNYLVFLNAQAGELEKILSGTKSMLVKECDPARAAGQPVSPGDSLYFMRNKDECALRVKATVVRMMYITNSLDEDLSHSLKELQPKLQLTEDQYNYWVAKKQFLLVEVEAAHKIPVIHVAPEIIKDQMDWIPFTELNLITEKEVLN
jgi:hypothetical protein